jgi:hypothetical protein
MPASEDSEKDREIFYKILTMDEDGLWRRKNKTMSAADIAQKLEPREYDGLIEHKGGTASWVRGVAKADKERLERIAFARLPYEDKLAYCCRPEEIEGPSPEAWKDINTHLGTSAHSLPELFEQLSQKAFGHTARVGDCFCGGGSVPFEAARLGLEAYGSDLNPVAVLLTWGAINLIGGGREVQEEVRRAQEAVWQKVDEQITAWGIEHDGRGNRATPISTAWSQVPRHGPLGTACAQLGHQRKVPRGSGPPAQRCAAGLRYRHHYGRKR